MNERCSCGTTLVEGALFCHRCGRPTREDLREQLAAQAEQMAVEAPGQTRPQIPDPAAAPAIDPKVLAEYSARRALRASLVASLLAFVSMSLLVQLLGMIGVVVALLPAGYLTVYLYRRGAPPMLTLTPRLGARIGWTTGVFAFLMFLIQLTAGVLISGGSFRATLMQQIDQQAVANPAFKEAAEMLSTSTGLAIFLATTMLFLFVACTLLTTLGGALGAQFGQRNRESH